MTLPISSEPGPRPPQEPFAARLHGVTRFTRYPQAGIVRLFRRYFESAPGWVLITTTGRKSGLPREVLLPCERFDGGLIVISTYGERSNWMRNMRANPRVRITCAGWRVNGRAEIVHDRATKQSLVSTHPFFPPAPFGLVNLLHRTLLRPVCVAFLRWWVRGRPVVVIRQEPT